MREIGSYEAKTRLSELLKEVEKGEVIVITRRGLPVAHLVPVEDAKRARAGDAIARLKEARKRRPKVSLDEILAWRHEGHRY